jgi:hypothetical protein
VTWTDTTALTSPITWKQNIILGPWIQTIIAKTDLAIQWVKAEILGTPASTDLGALTGTTFGSGATLVGSVLTIDSEQFNKVQLKLSPQIQKILKIQSPVTKEVVSSQLAYEERLKAVQIHATNVRGVNGSSLLCEVQPGVEQDLVFHKLTGEEITVSYKFIDNQGDGPISTKKPSNEQWSVMLAAS